MYIDVIENPVFARRLLDIVTNKIIKWISYTKELMGEPRGSLFPNNMSLIMSLP